MKIFYTLDFPGAIIFIGRIEVYKTLSDCILLFSKEKLPLHRVVQAPFAR
jgi:hypothetical protein